jgi:hypothetical protein
MRFDSTAATSTPVDFLVQSLHTISFSLLQILAILREL